MLFLGAVLVMARTILFPWSRGSGEKSEGGPVDERGIDVFGLPQD